MLFSGVRVCVGGVLAVACLNAPQHCELPDVTLEMT